MNPLRLSTAIGPFAIWLGLALTCRAATGLVLDDYVSNADLIVRVTGSPQPVADGHDPFVVDEVLKGLHPAAVLPLPEGSVKPGESALVLIPFKPPADSDPAVQPARNFPPPPRIWPINSKGSVHSDCGEITLDAVKKSIADHSPEQVGLAGQLTSAVRKPKEFAKFAAENPERAKYIRFVIALRDSGRTSFDRPPRWPQPIPKSLRMPDDSFPPALIAALEKNDEKAFAKSFSAWLNSGVMRDRQFKFAETLDEKLAARCNVAALTAKKKTPMPAAPRLPADVLFDRKISAMERMKLLAQLAQFWSYERFVAERADALSQVQAAPVDSETVRRAAFWEPRGENVAATAGAVALRKLAGDSSAKSAAVLEAAYFAGDDREVTGAARMAIKAKNKEFIAALMKRIQAGRNRDTSRAARQLSQEGVVEIQPVMLEWLKDKDRETRNGAALNLCWATRKENVPALLDAISAEKDAETKSLLLVALAQTGDKRGLDVLEAATREKKTPPWATLEIFRGLARAGDPQALATLAAAAVAFETSGGDEEDRVQLQAEAVNAFGLISKLYPAHEPDPLWQQGGWNPESVAKNIAAIKKWQLAQSPPAKK